MTRFDSIISAFPDHAIGVVGDIVADVYVLGVPARLSREAPVMVVRFEEERLIPGCAANTMNNLLELGCRVVPVSVMGMDDYGHRLRSYFMGRGFPLDSVVERPDFKTVSKTRIMVGDPNRTKQQVIRVDRELQREAPPGLEAELLAAIEKADRRVEAWLVSDYDYFVITPRVAEYLTRISKRKPLVVDSRSRCHLFKGGRCFTPNEGEAMAASGMRPSGEEDLKRMGWKLLELLEAVSLVITRGNEGMLVFEREGDMTQIPAIGEDEVVDVTGAGDTVAATLTAAIAAGASTVEAAQLASCAASVVVMKTGAGVCHPEELRERIALL